MRSCGRACVCMYACMCVCMCVCMYVCVLRQSCGRISSEPVHGTTVIWGYTDSPWAADVHLGFFLAAKVTQGQIWPIIANIQKAITSSEKVWHIWYFGTSSEWGRGIFSNKMVKWSNDRKGQLEVKHCSFCNNSRTKCQLGLGVAPLWSTSRSASVWPLTSVWPLMTSNDVWYFLV